MHIPNWFRLKERYIYPHMKYVQSYISIMLLGLAFIITSGLEAQIILHPAVIDTTFYKQNAQRRLIPKPRHKADIAIIEYYRNNTLTQRKRYDTQSNMVFQHEYYEEGRPSGKWLFYNRESDFTKILDFTKLVYGDCKEVVLADDIEPAKFTNGDVLKYVQRRIRYSSYSRALGTTGNLQITFMIDETGKAVVSHICGDGLDGHCDLMVWEIIEKMPRWKPARKNGKPVEVPYNLSVFFKL